MWVIHTGIYDDTIKSLVGKDPQVLITFLMKGAVYLGDVEQELKARTVHADALYYVWWHDQKMVMHIEFQVGKGFMPLSFGRSSSGRFRRIRLSNRIWKICCRCCP